MFENRQVLMAYTKPMVMVFQEYAQTSSKAQSATLSPCIIGPCYHIVDAVEDETLALLGKYDSSIERAFFPNNEPGAKIIEDSVSIRLGSSGRTRVRCGSRRHQQRQRHRL